MERTKKKTLSSQIRKHSRQVAKKKTSDGNSELMISTGSTLLDLAIGGSIKRGGGIVGGILMEVFGPEGSGKTVLLCEIGGAIQRTGGDIMFNDPEARLNKQFSQMFGLDTDTIKIKQPDTVTEVIKNIKEWVPRTKSKIHGIMTDSLAALSTRLEMDDPDGDKMGMRRAKEFSEGLRKICRILKKENYIMACSNQMREKTGATIGEKFTVPGGKAIGFYSSLRLRFFKPEKLVKNKAIKGKEYRKVIGTKVKVEVYKNSTDAPYRTADVYIIFDYGIDDIRANLQFLKDYTKSTVYGVGDKTLDKALDTAIELVEADGLERQLKEEVIDLWEDIQQKFKQQRKKKER